jgi:hypothetical protein
MQLYILSLIVLAMISVVMSIKDVALLVVMVTFGLGLPFVFAASCLIYALLAFPAVAMWPNGGRDRQIGCVASFGLAAIFAVMPNIIGRIEVNRQMQPLLTDDQLPSASASVRTLEIRRPPSDYSGFFADQEACGFECRSLLKSGRVDWVRIVKVDSTRRRVMKQRRARPLQWVYDETSTSSVFQGRSGPACAVTAANVPATGRCVAIANDSGEAADMVIELHRPEVIETKPGTFDFVVWRSTRAITAHIRSATGPVEDYRHTIVDADVVMMPTLIGPKSAGMSSGGTGLARSSRQFNKATFTQVLSTLGLPVDASSRIETKQPKPRNWQDGINDEMTRELVSVLELSQTTEFSSDQTKPVSDWMMHARQVKEWTPGLLALLRRIARDRRIKSPTVFDQIFEHNRRVTETLMPDILDLLEARGIDNDYTPQRQAAYTFSRLDPAVLKPHAARIVALIGRSRDLRAVLLPAVGRLGIDPTPLLLPIAADLQPAERSPYAGQFPRVRGACFAEPQWSPILIPALREALASVRQGGNDSVRREFRMGVLKALAKHGDVAFVDSELAGRPDRDDERLAKSIQYDLEDRRRINQLCTF